MDKYTGEVLANIHEAARLLKLGEINMRRVEEAIRDFPDDRRFISIQAQLEGNVAIVEMAFDESVIELWAIAALN